MCLMATMMVLSAMVACGVAAWVRRRAETLRLVHLPNHRSSHVQPTPNGGSLEIVVAGSFAGVGLVPFCKRSTNPNLFSLPFSWLNPVHANSTATRLPFLPTSWLRASHAGRDATRCRAPVHWPWPSAAASK